jgi:hypothetical protein
MRTKITFPPNVPQLVDLNDPAVLSPGLSGDQYQYILHGDKIMWVDPAVHAQIVALGATSGDSVAITKRVTPSANGTRGKTSWTVERVQDEPAEVPAPDWHEIRAGHAQPIDGRRHPQPAPAPAATPAPRPPQPAAVMAAQIPDRRQPAAAPQPASEADALLSALTTAIDVVALAEKHAARLGFPLHFEAADIRALASGLMIERRDRSSSRRAA